MSIPKAATISTSSDPLGTLMSPGWRLLWDGSKPTPGRMLARFVLKVRPERNVGQESEVLQIGVSRDPASLRSCLSYGLSGQNGQRGPDEVLDGITFKTWKHQDGGMSQSIDATDLRAVTQGTCFAIARFSYASEANDIDPSATLPDAAAAGALDDALHSFRLTRSQ